MEGDEEHCEEWLGEVEVAASNLRAQWDVGALAPVAGKPAGKSRKSRKARKARKAQGRRR